MSLLVLIISVWKEGLSYYICLLIHLTYFQPLEISCFAPLKYYYSYKIREMAQNGIHTIDKMDFLSIYIKIHCQAFSETNILSGFAAADLIPLKLERVLIKLNIKILTPSSSSSSNQSFYLGKSNHSLSIKSAEKVDSRPPITNSLYPLLLQSRCLRRI